MRGSCLDAQVARDLLAAELLVDGLDETSFVMKTLDRQRNMAKVRPVPLSFSESELLHKINVGLPEAIWEEYRRLVGKRSAETLTEADHIRLIALSDRIEISNAERISDLIQLAKLRNQSLDDLMNNLGIKPREL